MDALTYLRNEINSYFPESSELILDSKLAVGPRFNFYFKIRPDEQFLLYLNWDGDGDGFTLKCLEFESADILRGLMDKYPSTGSRIFNAGQPRAAVSFIYRNNGVIQPKSAKGILKQELQNEEVNIVDLLESIDPIRA